MNALNLSWKEDTCIRDNFYNLWCEGLKYRDAVGLDVASKSFVVVGNGVGVVPRPGTLYFKNGGVSRNPERLSNSKYWVEPRFDLVHWMVDWNSFMVFTNIWYGWENHYSMNIENIDGSGKNIIEPRHYIIEWLCINNIDISVEDWNIDG